jgi:hypothetical protein
MVDYVSYFQYGPPIVRNGDLEPSSVEVDCMCSDCQQNVGLAAKYRTHFDKWEIQANETWDDEQYMICPPRVLGYVLKEKQWAQLQTTLVKDIPSDGEQDAWHTRLQLDDEGSIKDLLFNLVRSHISESNQAKRPRDALEVDDIIPGKGKGLVILLYGMNHCKNWNVILTIWYLKVRPGSEKRQLQKLLPFPRGSLSFPSVWPTSELERGVWSLICPKYSPWQPHGKQSY